MASLVLLGSPGPAPLALAATGGSVGIRLGIPFLAGVLLGLAVAIVAAAVGLATLFETYPRSERVVQFIGGCYIAYLAYKIALAPTNVASNTQHARTPSFVDGFILNLLNPKAYAAFLAIFSQFLLPLSTSIVSWLMTAIICFSVAVLVDIMWLCFGGLLAPLFSHPQTARPIRVSFALMMVASVMWAYTR